MNGHFIKNKNKNVQEPITVFSKIKKKKKKEEKKRGMSQQMMHHK